MENRKIVQVPAHDKGPVTTKPDDFEPLQSTSEPKKEATATSGGGSAFDCPGGGRSEDEPEAGRH